MASHRTPRVVSARRLATRSERRRTGRFLAEGSQSVREALRYGRVHELFVTEDAASRYEELTTRAVEVGVLLTRITRRAAELLSETVTPQGIVAVCDTVDVPVAGMLDERATSVAVLVNVADPGNAGTVVRVADAAGADAVIFAGDTVDPHNGKCVRASTGSLFHLPIAHCGVDDAMAACRGAGLRISATTGGDGRDRTEITDLTEVTDLSHGRAWLFGGEAHGLAPDVLAGADERLRVPIYGRAESLNLGTAAAVCLYAAAMAPRLGGPGGSPRG